MARNSPFTVAAAAAATLLTLAALSGAMGAANAQSVGRPAAGAPALPGALTSAPPQVRTAEQQHAAPGFWDPRRRPERPDLSRLTVIRFITETDYPPFNFTGPDGNPAGFNVDLARLICAEIGATCTVQMRRFETLIASLDANKGDALIASMALTPELRGKLDFTDPYYRTPARFVALKANAMGDIKPEYLEGKTIGVVGGTAHEAFLKKMFTDAAVKAYPTSGGMRTALRRGEVDVIFGDAISLAFWLNGTDSARCCAFSGGPFLESRYFGEGVGIAVKPGNEVLRQALNWALYRVWESGRFTDLWLRYFPVNPF